MAGFTELNLEYGMPKAEDAMTLLQKSITQYRARKIGCVLIIHGYGSTGKGGVIRDKARRWLNAQQKNGTIKSVIAGEDFNIFNFKALELKNKYPELAQLLSVCNHGVTVAEL